MTLYEAYEVSPPREDWERRCEDPECLGWYLIDNRGSQVYSAIEIERCVECDRFASDDAAVVFVVTQALKQLPPQGVRTMSDTDRRLLEELRDTADAIVMNAGELLEGEIETQDASEEIEMFMGRDCQHVRELADDLWN